jgi:hypothetical protein
MSWWIHMVPLQPVQWQRTPFCVLSWHAVSLWLQSQCTMLLVLVLALRCWELWLRSHFQFHSYSKSTGSGLERCQNLLLSRRIERIPTSIDDICRALPFRDRKLDIPSIPELSNLDYRIPTRILLCKLQLVYSFQARNHQA